MTQLVPVADCSDCRECLRKSSSFNKLKKSEIDLISKSKKEVRFKAGEIIYKQGTSLTHVISFNAGLGKIYIEGLNGRNFFLNFLKPTTFIGGPGMYVDNVHHFSVSALEDSTTCFIDVDVFKQIIRQNPAFAEEFIKYISLNAIFYFKKFISLTQKQMHGRLADALIYLSEEVYNKNPFRLNISRQELGELSVMSTESTSRILKEFKEEKIIHIDGKTIEIINLKLLNRISITG